MNRASLLLASLALAAGSGCGGNVVVDTTSPGTGGSTTTTVTTTQSTVTTVTTVTTVPPSCGLGTMVEIVGDSGNAVYLPSICPAAPWNPTQSSEPVAYLVSGGPTSVEGIQVVACAAPGQGAEGIQIWTKGIMGPGTYATGDIAYTSPSGAIWQSSGQPFTLNIAQLGAVGEFIDGDFDGVVLDSASLEKHGIKGKLHVCRIPDELLP